jgi:hypothetical protein
MPARLPAGSAVSPGFARSTIDARRLSTIRLPACTRADLDHGVASPSDDRQRVTFTATVAVLPPDPTGTVTFVDGCWDGRPRRRHYCATALAGATRSRRCLTATAGGRQLRR